MVGDATVKLAVLIDADNAQSSMMALLLAEIAKYGTASVKRAYGDWTGSTLKGWKEQLLRQSIQPIQQFAYTSGKNATDSAMIIDAMDLLYTNRLDGFCLVSSDSDFTRLAARIRESGLIVYGFGERKTPKPFVVACDKFIYVENLVVHEEVAGQVVVGGSREEREERGEREEQEEMVRNDVAGQLRMTIEAASDEDGWARLADVGNLLTKRYPDFDSRTYGYSRLSELVAATGLFETSRRKPGEGKPWVVYVRDKRRALE
ncbi:NYN domain-containing protein [Diplogelasinospora grovesii]|uniref:NYN domain-containing protein n=1 Tax=Diplogelasinospora grovesii TaxID=303347 RepID=A0AAN6NAF3_9PEZI|nr:NYN domain-containing protein [Diplogelasinospora grovesii]